MYMKETLVFPSRDRSNYRIPSIVTSPEGTVFAFYNDRKDTLIDHADEVSLVYARKKDGMPWETVQELAAIPTWACTMGSAIYDEQTSTVMCSCRRKAVARDEYGHFSPQELETMCRRAEEKASALGIQPGLCLLFSQDDGDTWQEHPLTIEPISHTHWDGTVASVRGVGEGSGNGIQLKHSAYAGRLLMPTRFSIGQYHSFDEIKHCCYNNSIYSDDHGLTWKASAPVQLGTGEGTLIEAPDGTITFNSRAYFFDQKRYLATSYDGGASYTDFRTDDFLMEAEVIGCNASFFRVGRHDIRSVHLLPEHADGITLFANPHSADRDHMTVCISFDSGKTWSGTKLIYAGPCAYSCLTFSKASQHFFLEYEKGVETPYDLGVAVAEFDLEWLLAEEEAAE